MKRADPLVAAGLGLAFALFARTFRGPRALFWRRMTETGAVLGALAVVAEPSLRRERPRPRDVALGLAAAGALYGIFEAGDRFARRAVPGGAGQIGDIYALRALRPEGEIAARLALVIGPAEELFWRGLVLRRLARRHGRARAAAAAAGAYAAAHLVTANVTLVGAAATAGLFWSVAAALGMPMSALVASHVAWDVWIFLVRPTERVAEAPMLSAAP